MFAVTVARSYQSRLVGLKIALGHAIVEIPLMLLIYFGFASFFTREPVQITLYLAGGSVLVWMGINMLRRTDSGGAEKGAFGSGGGKGHGYHSVVAGVVTSLLNPYFFLWWAAVGSMLIMKSLTFGFTGFALLITVHLLCDFGWLAFISVLVHRTKSCWDNKVQARLITACSLLLMGFGGWFAYSGLKMVA